MQFFPPICVKSNIMFTVCIKAMHILRFMLTMAHVILFKVTSERTTEKEWYSYFAT